MGRGAPLPKTGSTQPMGQGFEDDEKEKEEISSSQEFSQFYTDETPIENGYVRRAEPPAYVNTIPSSRRPAFEERLDLLFDRSWVNDLETTWVPVMSKIKEELVRDFSLHVDDTDTDLGHLYAWWYQKMEPQENLSQVKEDLSQAFNEFTQSQDKSKGEEEEPKNLEIVKPFPTLRRVHLRSVINIQNTHHMYAPGKISEYTPVQDSLRQAMATALDINVDYVSIKFTESSNIVTLLWSWPVHVIHTQPNCKVLNHELYNIPGFYDNLSESKKRGFDDVWDRTIVHKRQRID